MRISLLVLPGTGQEWVTLPENATLQDLVNAKPGIKDRGFMIDGQTVTGALGNIALRAGQEVAAVQAVKGA